MNFVISQDLIRFIETLILPPGLFVILLLLTLLIRHRVMGKLLILAITISLYLLSTDRITARLAANLEIYPPASAEKILDQDVQAIVVFLADIYTNAPELNNEDALGGLSLERLSYAAILHKRTMLPIILSGGIANKDKQSSISGIAAKTLINQFNITPLAIEEKSRNTWENAHELMPILKKHNIKKIAIVTHAWHMPRSMYSLQQAGIDAIPASTFYYSKYQYIKLGSPGGFLGLSGRVPSGKYFYASINMLHESIGLLWYRLTKSSKTKVSDNI